MRTILAVAIFAICAAGLTGQEKPKYEKEGKFTAKFPTEPTVQTKSASGLTLHIVVADYMKGKGGYMVTYSDLPAEVLKAPKPETVLESSEKGLVENFKAKITKSEATKLGTTKPYPAREITAERDDFHLRGKLVLAGNRLYQVYVFGSKEFTEGMEAGAFLMSFAITD